MKVTTAIGGAALAGAGVTGYALFEARRFQVRQQVVPVLPPGCQPIRVLHLSDLHATPSQTAKLAFVRELAVLATPDLTIVTGDFLAHLQAVPVVLEALQPLLDRKGAFVLGSNDYYGPRTVNPLGYFAGPSGRPDHPPSLPWGDLVAGLRGAGWADLNNAQVVLQVGPERVAVVLRGVDDPHIGRDRYRKVAGPFPEPAALRVGVTHAPYLRILDAMVADGAELLIAGHTHGGQVCLPGGRAIVTNCDLDPRRASGLSRHRLGQRYAQDTKGGAWLHVNPGMGTAPSAPIRLFCRPTASILNLVSRDS